MFYDDNFGHWDDMDDPDMRDFYYQVQEESEKKRCAGCDRLVNLRPHYAYCNSCANKRERGWDI